MPTRDELGVALILFLPVVVLIILILRNGSVGKWAEFENALKAQYGDGRKARRVTLLIFLLGLLMLAAFEVFYWTGR